jgi:hypothetical protein
MIVATAEKNRGISFAVKLNFDSVIAINQGFLSFQYHFALQQSNSTPVYAYPSANAVPILFLHLASLMMGLIAWPIIGVIKIICTNPLNHWNNIEQQYHSSNLAHQLADKFSHFWLIGFNPANILSYSCLRQISSVYYPV